MIRLLGIKKHIEVGIREKLSISYENIEIYTKELLKFFDEVVILSTCNRTEIYFNTLLDREEALDIIFKIIGWDIVSKKYFFYYDEKDAINHLMKVVCGFHSRILGEDQILGQIKDASILASKITTNNIELKRLFQSAITCGKKFRTECKLYEIPVSSSSIVINEVLNRKLSRVMVIGYGDVGKLIVKYALNTALEEINIVVRNTAKVHIDDNRVKVIDIKEMREKINNMDCIISCTSSQNLIIRKEDINTDKKMTLFDLAIPRDIDEKINELNNIDLFNIDDISLMDDENKSLRKEKMSQYKFIIDDYIKEYLTWKDTRGLSSIIEAMKKNSFQIVEDRSITLDNKCKDQKDIEISKKLIKSTSDYYVNRAIEVLKEEKLKGKDEECLKILEKIFLRKI